MQRVLICMSKSIEFYFDFISPYSYIAHKRILDLNQRNNFNYKPILLGGLHNLGNITPPAFNEKKMKNMKNDCNLVSKKFNIPFIWNDKFPINSLYLMRGYLSIDENKKYKFIDECFDAYWKNNIDISNEKNLNQILDVIGLEKKKFFENIENNKTKESLKQLTNDAFEKDIFGAPTFVVNNKIFWGQDRLDYAIEEYNS